MPTGEAHASLGVGVFVLLGGVAAFVRRGSTASLVASGVVGSSYLAASYLISSNKAPGEGHLLAGATGVALGGAMGARFYRTGKVFPPGVLAALGLGSATYELAKAKDWLM